MLKGFRRNILIGTFTLVMSISLASVCYAYLLPDPPTNLTASAVTVTQVYLSWTEPTNTGDGEITGYKILRSINGGGFSIVVFSTQSLATAYLDAGLTPGAQYSYKVAAISSFGPGSFSDVATVILGIPPSSPTNLTASAVSSSQIDLSWVSPANNGSAIIGYKIERQVGGLWSVLVANTGSTSTAYSNSGLAINTQYGYRVSAINAFGTGVASTVASATTNGTPSAPTGLTTSVLSSSQIKLFWTEPASNGGSDITGYKVYRSDSSGTETLLTTLENVLTYTNTGLTSGTTYFYKVSAINGIGEGSLSAEASATPSTGASALIEFTSDTILDLAGLNANVYIEAGSKCGGELSISDSIFSATDILSGNHFTLGTNGRKIIEIVPSDLVDFSFSTNDLSQHGYIKKWTEGSASSVNHIVGVPRLNTNYIVKLNGTPVVTRNSGSSREITFPNSGSGEYEIIAPAGDSVDIYGYAWSENVGWISFNKNPYGTCPGVNCIPGGGGGYNYKVTIGSDGELSGYAWSKNIGWIKFNLHETYPGEPYYSAYADLPGLIETCPGGSAGDYKVCGWARACSVFQSGCEGELNPNRGGWDGWIRLQNNVYIDDSVSPAQFHNYFWGGNPDNNLAKSVIGWGTFNCAEGSASGTSVCATSNYKVVANFQNSVCGNNIIEGSEECDGTADTACPGQCISPGQPSECTCGTNQPPTISLLRVTSNYCNSGPEAGSVLLGWTYEDPDSNQEIKYQIQVSSSAFSATDTCNSCEIDDIVTGQWASGVLNDYPITVTGAKLNNVLPFGDADYHWRVRAWDSGNLVSEWAEYDGIFETATHAWPSPSFIPSPTSTNLINNSATINFIDSSQCYHEPCAYSWDFDDDSTCSDISCQGDASNIYSLSGQKNIALELSDDIGSCTSYGTVIIRNVMNVPEWREVSPF